MFAHQGKTRRNSDNRISCGAIDGNNERQSPFGMVGTFDYGNHEKVADIVQDIGVKWNRLWFDYDSFVDENGEIDLDEILFTDTIIDLALGHDIQLFASVTMYSAIWDDELDSPNNEKNFQKYEHFLAYLVEHFKGRIDYWEIWNEPEADVFWKPAPNAVIYTQLLQRAYTKAKEVNQEAKIVGLSSVSSRVDFIEETFQNDALNYMDILGLHPYCYLDPNYKSIFEISDEYNRIDDIRGLMIDHHGKIKPIWVTEVGYPTYKGEFGVTEQRQAEMLVRSFVMLIVKDIEVIAWTFDEIPNTEDGNVVVNTKNIQLNIDGVIENIYDIYKNSIELPSLVNQISIEISSSPIYIIGDFDILNPDSAVGAVNRSETRSWSDFVTQA